MHYILRQEIVFNIYYLIFIFVCSSFALKLRPRNVYFKPSYFSCLYEIFKEKKYYFILILLLWLCNFLINIMYIAIFELYDIYNLSIAYFIIGAIFGFLPLIITCFFIHFGERRLTNDKKSTRFSKYNQLVFLIWVIVASIAEVGTILTVYYTTKNFDMTTLISSVTHIFVLISMIFYYNMKLKRELIYLSFKQILAGKIKNFNEWITWLRASGRQTIKLKKHINRWVCQYGFEGQIKCIDNQFRAN